MYDKLETMDNLAWDRMDEHEEKGKKQLRLKTTCRKVEQLTSQQLKGTATLIPPLIAGGFNLLYRVRVAGMSHDVMVRLALPGAVHLPTDKTRQEAATASLVAKATTIPLPRLLHHGQDPTIGPYLIIEHLEHDALMLDRMNTPGKNDSDPAVLDPNISDQTLASLWYQVARCQIQLFQIKLPRIGSLVETKASVYEVADRPIMYNLNTLLTLANIPQSVLLPRGKTYSTANDFYTACAEMHLAQLIFQRNDVITSADDCRNKYVARQVFRRLAKQGKLSLFGFAQDEWSAQSLQMAQKRNHQKQPGDLASAPDGTSSFHLFGEDFRPGNILVDKSDKIVGIIDWEFTNSVPTQFSLDPPWWLLLNPVEDWEGGMDNWVATYEPRLQIWLDAMERAEKETASLKDQDLPVPLSQYMRESWATGRFWLNYAARKTRTFDSIYWRYLDERFFGARKDSVTKDELWKTRVHLLSKKERDTMEELVQRKVEDMKERQIIDWDPIEAHQHFAKFLVE